MHETSNDCTKNSYCHAASSILALTQDVHEEDERRSFDPGKGIECTWKR